MNPPAPASRNDKPDEVRFDIGFYIGPCTEEEATALAEAILDLPEFKAVGGGAVSIGSVPEEGNP